MSMTVILSFHQLTSLEPATCYQIAAICLCLPTCQEYCFQPHQVGSSGSWEQKGKTDGSWEAESSQHWKRGNEACQKVVRQVIVGVCDFIDTQGPSTQCSFLPTYSPRRTCLLVTSHFTQRKGQRYYTICFSQPFNFLTLSPVTVAPSHSSPATCSSFSSNITDTLPHEGQGPSPEIHMIHYLTFCRYLVKYFFLVYVFLLPLLKIETCLPHQHFLSFLTLFLLITLITNLYTMNSLVYLSLFTRIQVSSETIK